MKWIVGFLLNLITPLRIKHVLKRTVEGNGFYSSAMIIGHTKVYISIICIVKWQRTYPWTE